MRNYIGRMVVLVEDYDQALQFYQSNFGFTILFDETTDTGQRYLHIGTDGKESLGIWFLLADQPEQKKLVGHQAGGQPLMVIYTSLMDELYQLLLKNRVKIKIDPRKSEGYIFLQCFDLYGNVITIVEMAGE
jgi:predicted enzyme related to lactoylglutathione lyase